LDYLWRYKEIKYILFDEKVKLLLKKVNKKDISNIKEKALFIQILKGKVLLYFIIKV
jgi:hypothetical protein